MNISLLHTSDWHLGRSLFGQSLVDDQTFIIEQILQLIDKIKPHAVLISGDIFDRPLPPEAAVKMFDQFLFNLVVERKIPVLIIPGNHDSAERVGFASRLLRERGLTIFSKPEDALKPIEIAGDGGSALIFGIPFLEPALIGEFLGRADLKTPNAALQALCVAIEEKFDLDALPPAVLLCHAFVVGAESSESERDLFIGGSSAVDASIFKKFSYTALGHLHKPQGVGSENRVRYSGSPLAYSKSEASGEKSVTEIHIKEKGALEVIQHPLKPVRRLRVIKGTLEELLQSASLDTLRDDYIIAELSDRGPVVDAHSKLRRLYPALLHVSRSGGFEAEGLPSLAEQVKEKETVTELELLSDFFKDTTGEALTTAEQDIVIEILRELEAVL